MKASNNIQGADTPANPMHLQLNRSVSAYPSFPRQSLQQQLHYQQQQQQQTQLQQQLLLQQQQIQQQQIQQQIELQQQQLQEQQIQQQQKLHQLQLQQQKQRMINQTLLETPMSTSLLGSSHRNAPKSVTRSVKNGKRMSNNISRMEVCNEVASKPRPTSKPLYERSSLTEKQDSHNHQCKNYSRHLSQCNLSSEHHRHHYSSYISTNEVSSHNSSDVPDTPPPEKHLTLLGEHVLVDSEEKVQPETEVTQLQPVSTAEKFESEYASIHEEGISIENIYHVNSSTSTLAEESMNEKEERNTNFDISKVCHPIKLPQKLKRELQNMQLRRSPYSAPDLSTFLENGDMSDRELRNKEKSWDEVQLFATSPSVAVVPINADGTDQQKAQMPALDSAIIIDAELKPEMCTPISSEMNALEKDYNQEEQDHSSTIKHYDSKYSYSGNEKRCCSSSHHVRESHPCYYACQPHHHQKGSDNRCTRKHEHCSSNKHHNKCSSSSASTNRCSNSNSIDQSCSAYSMDGCVIASNDLQLNTHHCHHNSKKHCKHNHKQHTHRCRKQRDSRSRYILVEDMRL